MYLSHTRAADSARTGPKAPDTEAAGPSRVPGAVLALGMVSLVTDASAEMVTAVLPMYLVYGLGVGYLQLGFLDGLYTGATALFRLGGGYAADRLGRPKTVAAFGYGLSAVSKLGFPLAGASTAGIGGVLAADRTGKGIRTGPRDALITAATPTADLGRAFGVHRALDTCGAMLGPLLAFALMWALPGDYDAVFLVSFCLGATGVVALVFFVQNDGATAVRTRLGGLRECLGTLSTSATRRVLLVAVALGLATVGDMFFYVALQQRMALSERFLPLLPLGTAGVFMLAAIPLGRVADRFGRWRLFLCGHLLLLGAYVLVVAASSSWPFTLLVLALHGGFYAATDGVLMAHVAPSLPERVRATGLAAVQTGQALARAGGALAFGVTAAHLGLTSAFTVFAGTLALVLAAAALARTPGSTP
ncbi:MFS transporter [Streptomyces sp. NA04227]|uniref:MFS transporter n=1 Tax=Streptomyces sp. NA04227 TaxID=2742136 RepID=UPI00158FD88F|nr:MFS transporter [Streptomyces sp. NA04227]QKW06184.1 MFS transporter [Streptomyces sp. NA04227]